MTGKPITWDEIEAVFARCEEIHVSPNIAEELAAQVDRSPKGGDARRLRRRRERGS